MHFFSSGNCWATTRCTKDFKINNQPHNPTCLATISSWSWFWNLRTILFFAVYFLLYSFSHDSRVKEVLNQVVALSPMSSTAACLLCPLSRPCHLLVASHQGRALLLEIGHVSPNWHSPLQAAASPAGSKVAAGELSTPANSNLHLLIYTNTHYPGYVPRFLKT